MGQTPKEEELQDQLIQIGVFCRRLREINSRLERENKAIAEELSNMKLSKSWRYTQRLRNIYTILRTNSKLVVVRRLWVYLKKLIDRCNALIH